MCKEECDKYQPKLKNYRDKTCIHFLGNKEDKHQIERCFRHCDIYGIKIKNRE